MVYPGTLPSAAFQQVDRKSRLLFHWRARDLLLETVEGVEKDAFTRASAGGLVTGRQGRLVGPHADGVPRFGNVDLDGDGVFETSAFRKEGARTNKLLRSEEFDNASWTKTNVSVVANDAVAPDGTTTADKLTMDATGGRITQDVTVNAGATVAFSFYVKRSNKDWVRVLIHEAGDSSKQVNAWFNISTGQVGTTGTGAMGGTFARAYIAESDLFNGYFRLVLVGSVATVTSYTAWISLADSDGSNAGSIGDECWLWGAQLEEGEFASSYVPTTTATVSRSAEDPVFDYLAAPQNASMYMKFREIGAIHSNLFMGMIGSNNDEFWSLLSTPAGVYRSIMENGAGAVSADMTTTPSIGDTVELLSTLGDTIKTQQSINEGTVEESAGGSITLPAAWSNKKLYIGKRDLSTTPGFGDFISVKVAAGVQSMQTMRELL